MTLSIRAILFDLDDTLLGNDIDAFLKSYLPLLANYVSAYIDPESFVRELMFGTQAMIENRDPGMTNAEVFWSVFSERTGLFKEDFEPIVDEFYEHEFSKLRSLTSQRPEASPLVEYCFKVGYRVVIATNPLFPMTAIKQRLRWAGIPLDKYKYDLVTSYENMHATKPRAEYYAEILSLIDATPERSIMVGDDWSNDIEGASQAGLHTFWISRGDNDLPGTYPGFIGHGSLSSFHHILSEGDVRPIV